MSEWLWWLLGLLCGLFAVVKVLGTIGCLVELYRKWRGAPELWGLDWLDIVWRLQREFGIALTAANFAGLSPEGREALTAEQLWEVVVAQMRETGREVPSDGWQRLVAVLSEALNVKPDRITPAARLSADLGMMPGLE